MLLKFHIPTKPTIDSTVLFASVHYNSNNKVSLLNRLKPYNFNQYNPKQILTDVPLRKFYGRQHDLVDRYGISESQLTTDMFHLS